MRAQFVALGFLWALALNAQQTIFDVPSADVSVSHDWFYQHQTVARTWNPGRVWVQTNAFGYGVGHHTELDVTWFNLDTKQPRESSMSVGFKSALPLTGEAARVPMSVVVGDQVQFGLRGERGDWGFALMHAQMPKLHTKLTGGLNYGTKLLFGQRTVGFMGGVEQPISRRWMLQGDWFSGRHDLSFAIPGVVYRFQRRWMVSLGYQIPNRHAAGPRAVVFELTRF